jgi:hypothetical protein
MFDQNRRQGSSPKVAHSAWSGTDNEGDRLTLIERRLGKSHVDVEDKQSAKQRLRRTLDPKHS